MTEEQPPKSSIFQKYYNHEPLTDRFLQDSANAVDVIIPVMHSNEVWRSNLCSLYREIPVKRLLVGNAGCIDDTLTVLQEFPRVTVYDHTKFVSLGYSIRKLIEEVQTEWFVYLHSDVYLPEGWFDEMYKHQNQYDWYECRQHITVLVDYPLEYTGMKRPFSGSQMGRTDAFKNVLPKIDDDYLYRNEDLVYTHLIEKAGFRYGRVDDTFHYHQVMNKRSRWRRTIRNVRFDTDRSREELVRENTMQLHGIIKYMEPSDDLLKWAVSQCIYYLTDAQELQWEDFKKWVATTNPAWLPYVHRFPRHKKLARNLLQWLARHFGKFLQA